MQTENRRPLGLRIKRFLLDEWGMLALLTAALAQTGMAVYSMNGMVMSHHQIPVNEPQASITAPLSHTPLAVRTKETLAVAGPLDN